MEKRGKKGKKGNILTENIIFIVLYLAFITILLLFLFSKTNGTAVLEEKYAKQIALTIDAAKPGMIIHLSMEDAIEKAVKDGQNPSDIVSINGNVITVKLSKKGNNPESSYSFFNDVQANGNFDTLTKKEYYFVINEK